MSSKMTYIEDTFKKDKEFTFKIKGGCWATWLPQQIRMVLKACKHQARSTTTIAARVHQTIWDGVITTQQYDNYRKVYRGFKN